MNETIAIIRKVRDRTMHDYTIPYREKLAAVKVLDIIIEELEKILAISR